MRREMKQSGYAWIGDIPQEWSLVPFGRLLNERNEKNNPVQSEERLSLSIELGVTLYSEKTTNLDRFKEDFSQYKLAHKGDLVMNSMNMIVGASGVSKYYGCVSPAYYTFYDNEENHITAKFCEYIFKSKPMMRLLHSLGKGIYAIDRGDDKVNTCRLKVAKHDLKNIEIPLPSIEEQYRIVKTINDMCSKVDTLIANQQKQIEKLKQYKQSLITEVVTKGLNPDVEMKETEFGENQPCHWNYTRLKFATEINKSTLIPVDIEEISYSPMECVRSDSFQPKTISTKKMPTGLSTFKEGDVLLAKITPCFENGNVAIAKDLLNGYGVGSSELIPFKPIKIFDRFLMYLFQSNRFVENGKSTIRGIGGLRRVTMDFIYGYSFYAPEIEEQREIVDYLDEKCQKIEKLIDVKQQKIDKLNQYKKSIIYEYVTGKKEA